MIWAQWTLLAVVILELLLQVAMQGKPRTGRYCFGTFIGSIIGITLMVAAGAFCHIFGWPR